MTRTLSTARISCLVFLTFLSVGGITTSPAQSQNRYTECVRQRSWEFTMCLRESTVTPAGARYASCADTWKRNKGTCWANYQIFLANRGSVWNPSPSFSRGPLYPRYSRSSPLYRPSYSRAAPSAAALVTRYPASTMRRYSTPSSVVRNPVYQNPGAYRRRGY